MTAALIVAAVVLALAPAFVTRTVTRGRRAARYTAVDLARDAVTAWREARPAAAFDRHARRAVRARRRALPDTVVALHTPTSIDMRSAA